MNTSKLTETFTLESGETINNLQLGYHTYGELNQDKNNVVWVFHALTANSDVMSWWPGLFGEADLFNPEEHFIICVTAIGSPYGSTTPNDLYFPQFTVRDVVKAQLLLAKELEIEKIHVAIGGSFGGSQALEFAYSYEGKIDNLILVASAALESAWGIAIHESQRLALQADPTFGEPAGGKAGLKAARAMGMVTYRSSEYFIEHQTEADDRTGEFRAASYIQHQGEKLKQRFDALSYYYLINCLDTHNIGRNRGGLVRALSKITCRTLVIGIESDQLIRTKQQVFLADNLPNASYREIESKFGHDGFLVETGKITSLIDDFLEERNVLGISTEELSILIKRSENFQLIDVREPFELELSSIGGINIPLAEIPTHMDKISSNKKVIVYCRSGRRSATAIQQILKAKGHSDIYNLEGGILDWADKIDNTMELY